ncbi:hypothetical protein C8R43DRAFT_1205955 [Mycena crocata]|nr:hypothetical protein C8R43DRAFT_1205955 [Mycena crocata]
MFSPLLSMDSSLNDDVLIHILEFCDVSSALAMSAGNKHFRSLTFTKQVWVAILRELVHRLLVELPSKEDLCQYTPQQVIDEVKRVVLGPKSWSKLKSDLPLPVLRRKNVLKHEGIPPPMEIGEVETGKHMWSRPQPATHYPTYAIDLQPDKMATLVLVPKHNDDTCPVSVLRIDLATGGAKDVFKRGLRVCGWSRPSVRGDFIAISVLVPASDNVFVVVVNLALKRCVTFRLVSGKRVMTALVPGNLVLFVAEPTAPHGQLLILFPFHSVSWRTLSVIDYIECVDVFDRIYVFGQGSIKFLGVDPESAHVTRLWQLMVRESPLRRDTYKISIYTSDSAANPYRNPLRAIFGAEPRATLFSFRLSLAGKRVVGMEATSERPAVPELHIEASYAGYSPLKIKQDATRIVALCGTGSAKGWIEDHFMKGMPVDLNTVASVGLPSSGAMTTWETPRTGPLKIVVSYYS